MIDLTPDFLEFEVKMTLAVDPTLVDRKFRVVRAHPERVLPALSRALSEFQECLQCCDLVLNYRYFRI